MNDAELLTDFVVHRDQTAFEVLVRRHGPMVLNVCRDILGDGHDAEDAFQATFMVLVRNASSIRDRSSLGLWLYEVAAKTARRARQQSARRLVTQRQVVSMDTATVAEPDPTRNELRPVLHTEIQQLPTRLRDAIVLCYLEGFAIEAAAKRLDCPVATLKSRLSKGREILRSRLIRRGLGVTAVLLLLTYLTDEASAAPAVPDELVHTTVESGLKTLLDRSIFSKFVQKSQFDRPWLRRFMPATALLTLFAVGVPIYLWSNTQFGPRAEASTFSQTSTTDIPERDLDDLRHCRPAEHEIEANSP